MAINSRNPQYGLFFEDWDLMTDAYGGERRIKDHGIKYLPPTSGMVADGMNPGQEGYQAYQAYLLRAVFPDLVRTSVAAMVGVMHSKPPVIELPPSMEPLRDHATNQGESLEMLLRNINEAQMVTGRSGLLVDVADEAPVGTLPYLAQYIAQAIINWDDGERNDPELQNLNLVVLDESEYVRTDDFEWEFEQKYRVLVLGDPDENEAIGQGQYRFAVYDEQDSNFSFNDTVAPSVGGRKLNFIPFTFINAADIVPQPDNPPLLGLSQLSLTIYRGEADYRQSLFMQGQDTLVVIGGQDEEFRMGANASILLPSTGDAKFIGVNSDGLPEQRAALENDRKIANAMGAQLLDQSGRTAESGEALRIRVGANTATLNQVALAGAFGLENALRQVARWVGANPQDVNVIPNLDFSAEQLAGRTLVEYMTAKSMGAPYSLRSIHGEMEKKDITAMTFEEEMAEIEKEQDGVLGTETGDPVDDMDDTFTEEVAVDEAAAAEAQAEQE